MKDLSDLPYNTVADIGKALQYHDQNCYERHEEVEALLKTKGEQKMGSPTDMNFVGIPGLGNNDGLGGGGMLGGLLIGWQGAFPAHAGMNRPLSPNVRARACVPRTRGDEPPNALPYWPMLTRSPHTRG